MKEEIEESALTVELTNRFILAGLWFLGFLCGIGVMKLIDYLDNKVILGFPY
jgi:hypothetical protein